MILRFFILQIFLTVTLSIVAQTNVSDTISANELQEVIVTGERPQIKSKNGALSVDITAITAKKPISNIYEALPYVPGIVYDAAGGFSLSGGNGLTLLINGRKPQMPIENVITLLQSYPIERLKGIDILYSTPAKYHVDGSSLNIILKDNSFFDGLQAQARMDYEQQYYSKGGTNLSAKYTIGKFSTDIIYRYNVGKSWAHQLINSQHRIENTETSIVQEEKTTSNGQKHNGHLGIEWDISSNHKINASYDFQISPMKYSKNYSSGTLGQYTTSRQFPNHKILNNLNISYESPFGLSVGATATSYRENSITQLYSYKADKIVNEYLSSQNIKRYNLYIDQVHNLNDWEINYGGSLDISRDRSSQEFNSEALNNFSNKLKEYSMDIYIGTEHSFNNGLSFSLSFKGDYYNRQGQAKWWFSPQIGLTYMKTPEHIFQWDLSSSKDYPSYWEIHGGKTLLNNYMMIVGNPNLKPSYSYENQFIYLFRQKYMAVLYYKYTDDYFAQLPYQLPNTLSLIYQTQNFNYNQMFGLMIRIPISLHNILNSSLTLNGYYTHIKGNNFDVIDFNTKKYSFYADLDNSIKLSSKTPIYLSVAGTILSPSLQGYADLSTIWKIDLGSKLTFLKGNADLIIKWTDIFNTWAPTLTMNKYGQSLNMKTFDLTNSFRVSFVYRFNGFKPKNTNIDQSRFGMDK